jgi:hypothetical protein
MNKPKFLVFFIFIFLVNTIVIYNLSTEIFAFEEKEENSKYKEKNFKIYNDYIVKEPFKYGSFDPIDDDYDSNEQNNNNKLVDQKPLYSINPSISNYPNCIDIPIISDSDSNSLVSLIEDDLNKQILIQVMQLINEIDMDLGNKKIIDEICKILRP